MQSSTEQQKREVGRPFVKGQSGNSSDRKPDVEAKAAVWADLSMD
jgi:hypothetical protein